MKSKKTIFNNTEDIIVFNNKSGEIFESDKLTIEEFLQEPDAEEKSGYFMTDYTFIKSFRGNGIMLKEKLTNTEIATLVFLSDFICYEDCVLRTNGNKKGDPLTIKDLSSLIGVNYDAFRRTITSLKKKQVIGFHSTGDSQCNTSIKWITVNPFIFCRGTKIEKWVIEFYAKSEWAEIERQKIKNQLYK